MKTQQLHAVSGDTTEPRTLWTLTMVEILCDDLVRERPDQDIHQAIRELYARNVKPSWLVRKVARELGGEYSSRLRQLLESRH